MLSVESRVGFLLLAALAVLIGFVLLLGHVRLSPGTLVAADFAYAGHLQPDAPVRLSGIDAGYVKRIELLAGNEGPPPAKPVAALGRIDPPQVRATLRLDRKFAPLLRQGTTFAVATTGVIGETYLEWMPPPHSDAPMLAEQAVVRGIDAARLHTMTLQAQAIMQGLEGLLTGTAAPSDAGQAVAAMLGTINEVLASRKDKLGEALDNLSDGAADAKTLLETLRTALGNGATLRQLVGDAGATMATAKPGVAQLMEHGDAVLLQLAALSERAQEGLDPNAMSRMLQHATHTAGQLSQASDSATRLLQRIERGEGTVGGLVQDPQIYDDIRELMRDLKRHPWKVLWRD